MMLVSRLDKYGVGVTEGGERISFALPGEQIHPGPPLEILESTPDRIAPVCRHFGTCGGCALQHQSHDATAIWKRSLLTEALARRGIETDIKATTTLASASRRRAVLALGRKGKDVLLGLRAAGGHAIVDLRECPVLVPAIAEALPKIRHVLAPLAPNIRQGGRRNHAGGAATVTVLATETGLDIAVTRPKKAAPVDARTFSRLASNIVGIGWARLTLDDELVAATTEPILTMGRARVMPPPAAFVQALAACETALFTPIDEALDKAKRSLDLFCGIGTFALRMAEKASVHAVDSVPEAVAALQTSAQALSGLKPITTSCRDLYQSPMTAHELRHFDLVVFDPPRAGAEAQARQIASSKVPVAIGVSCNPDSFARDAAILIAGGFALESLTPVDQFRYSPHVECVGIFRR